jgi:tRNA(Ile)-lysidine synthetase-like protein
MLSRLRRTIAEHDLFAGPLGTRVLVAVSGGPDSMALLAGLWELSGRLGLTLEVAVVDHGLRAEAAREGDLVAERASALGLQFHRLRVDVGAARSAAAGGGVGQTRSGAAEHAPTGTPEGAGAGTGARGGLQEVARRLRLEALEGLARARRLGAVALGHNADDQSETVLFRVLRGTGVEGLAGIPYRRGCLARPLLDVSRAQILEYLRLRSIPFAEDPSNRDLRFARARIRHLILPMLRHENPRIDEALQRLAASASGRFPAPEVLGRVAIPSRIAVSVAEAARAARGTRSFDLSDSRRIVVTYGRVEVIQSGEGAAGGPRPSPVEVPGAGEYALAGGVTVLVRDLVRDAQPDGDLVWFDGERLAWPLTLRGRRAGDRMRPRGGRGTRKLADLMIDAKIPRHERERLPVVVAADGELLFVGGLRPSEAGRPGPGTRRWIGLAVRPPKARAGERSPAPGRKDVG